MSANPYRSHAEATIESFRKDPVADRPDAAELDKCNPGVSSHKHHFGHSNLQESQLAKIDSDAKEGSGRNNDGGPIVRYHSAWAIGNREVTVWKSQ